MKFPVISIQQPWAEAILALNKDVENRTWRCPAQYLNRTVLIHAGLRVDAFAMKHLASLARVMSAKLKTGGIVGAVTIISGDKREVVSAWADDDAYNWELRDARRVTFYPCKGRLGFFEIEYPYPTIGIVP